MSKAPVDIIKYIIHADAEAKGLVEKPDLIGAIFGQTEGLLGEDLDLRELQKSGRIGRIDADIETKSGVTKAKVTVPSSLDMVETSIIAAGIETISRIGPCDASFKITQIEDVREAKREVVVNRARELLKNLMDSGSMPDTKEMAEGIRADVRTGEIIKYRGLDAGSDVPESETIILVEGRADVLNLLRNGIRDSVAVGGIKIPKEAIDLCNERTTTVFVDGDRGGDLIIKSLQNAGAKIDYIARAPPGREVEGLARKEVIMALRRKSSPEAEAAPPLKRVSSRSSRSDSRSRSSSRERPSRESRSSRSDSRSRSSSRESSSRESRSRSSRDERTPRERPSRERGSREERPRREPRERSPRSEEPKEESVEDKLLIKLGELKNKAILLDKDLKGKEISIDELKKKKKLDAFAVVMDDIITEDIAKKAAKAEYLVGITTADSFSAPKGKKILTKF